MGADGEALARDYPTGLVCRGMVTAVTDFAAFVDLDGIDAVVTAVNISWNQFDRISDVVRVGQEVTGLVLSVDPYRNQVSLSLKELQHDSFLDFARTRLGATLSGRVVKVAPIGIFLRLEGDVSGFLPAFELQRYGPKTDVGDVLTVEVSRINVAERKVVVSIPGRDK
ncbi:S1 RNA-binding domain-containing protein [Streptomyces sp. E11-3]|uniref:S1 RNA-binding domain-containing protein n=1 Tax=Streptomyces sp. E11-3 TaxID=3110112 RepID=UPI00397FCC22